MECSSSGKRQRDDPTEWGDLRGSRVCPDGSEAASAPGAIANLAHLADLIAQADAAHASPRAAHAGDARDTPRASDAANREVTDGAQTPNSVPALPTAPALAAVPALTRSRSGGVETAKRSDVPKRTHPLLGQMPPRLELRGRQRRTAAQGVSLGTCKRSPSIGLGVLREGVNRRYGGGGCRSLARHGGPFPF